METSVTTLPEEHAACKHYLENSQRKHTTTAFQRNRTAGVQLVKGLPYKHEALSSRPTLQEKTEPYSSGVPSAQYSNAHSFSSGRGGNWAFNQDPTLARQVLYHVSQACSHLCFRISQQDFLVLPWQAWPSPQ
jgi:hypothetical protein